MSAPRKLLRRFDVSGHAHYITCSCRHRLPLFNNDAIKQAFRDHLATTHARLRFLLLAWVIMPEHIHVLVLPDESLKVSAMLSALKRPFSESVLARWRTLGAPILPRITDPDGQSRFWQPGGGYDRNIFTEDERAEKIRYIHLNPVRRGLVEKALDWPWSSARAYRGLDDQPPHIDAHFFKR